MKEEVIIPEIGESITSGIIAAWLKNEGDYVAEGDELFELETDKATLAVPSTSAGTLKRFVQEGDEVEVGQVVAEIDSTGKPPIPQTSAAEPVQGAIDWSVLSPAVRRIVEEYKLDPVAIKGTGPKGRITKADALSAVEHAESKAAGESKKPPVPPAPPSAMGNTQNRVKMSSLRKRIAENLVQSKQASAHLTTFNEIDMSAVMDIRKSYRDTFEKQYGVRLGFMSFFVKACCRALAAFPSANGSIDGDDIILNSIHNIGVAVSTERGLIVPVLKDADGKSFAEIENEILSFAIRAKEKKITVDELTGGTFTITNGGVFGSLLSTPIPTPPQSAIIGMHSIQKRPVVLNDQIVIRPMMYVAVTYDHRIMDGREAVSFLVKIKQLIEDPNQMLIGL